MKKRKAVITSEADGKQTWLGLNPVNKVLFFSPKPLLKLSSRPGTLWTSSGTCFLRASSPGPSSDRAGLYNEWETSSKCDSRLAAGSGTALLIYCPLIMQHTDPCCPALRYHNHTQPQAPHFPSLQLSVQTAIRMAIKALQSLQLMRIVQFASFPNKVKE